MDVDDSGVADEEQAVARTSYQSMSSRSSQSGGASRGASSSSRRGGPARMSMARCVDWYMLWPTIAVVLGLMCCLLLAINIKQQNAIQGREGGGNVSAAPEPPAPASDIVVTSVHPPAPGRMDDGSSTSDDVTAQNAAPQPQSQPRRHKSQSQSRAAAGTPIEDYDSAAVMEASEPDDTSQDAQDTLWQEDRDRLTWHIKGHAPMHHELGSLETLDSCTTLEPDGCDVKIDHRNVWQLRWTSDLVRHCTAVCWGSVMVNRG